MTPLVEVPWPGRRRRTPFFSSARTCSRWAPSRFAAPTTCWRSSRAERGPRGVITYSSGNHGQAVALPRSALGAPAVIVMPTTAPRREGGGRARLRRRGDVCRHDVDRPQGARRSGGRRARADDRAAVRSPDDHRRRRARSASRSSSSVPDVAHRARADRRRRAELRRRRGHQAARPARARRRRRARRAPPR